LRSNGVERDAKPYQTLKMQFLRQRSEKDGGEGDKREKKRDEEKHCKWK
jgi:hypothetical protein